MDPLLDDLSDLPGEPIIRVGLKDLQAQQISIPACLVAVGLARLQRSGLATTLCWNDTTLPEHSLYALLRKEGGNAYSRYNALVRLLVSFERALEHRRAHTKN